jgi:hypothetical protein
VILPIVFILQSKFRLSCKRIGASFLQTVYLLAAHDYLDFSRSRNTASCAITTDFHKATPKMFAAVDAEISRINFQVLDAALSAIRAITAGEVGVSIGINSWSDYWLLKTFSADRTKDLIVILGHDWYPIVDEKGIWSINSPLFIDAPYGRYAKAFDPATHSRKRTALLFVNLVPDLRTIGASKVGKAQD